MTRRQVEHLKSLLAQYERHAQRDPYASLPYALAAQALRAVLNA